MIEKGHKSFSYIEKTSLETVVKIEGLVLERSNETINKDLKTGEIATAQDGLPEMQKIGKLKQGVYY